MLQLELRKKYTNAVPASATNAERKLKKRAFETVKPDLTNMPKSPICNMYSKTYRAHQRCKNVY